MDPTDVRVLGEKVTLLSLDHPSMSERYVPTSHLLVASIEDATSTLLLQGVSSSVLSALPASTRLSSVLPASASFVLRIPFDTLEGGMNPMERRLQTLQDLYGF